MESSQNWAAAAVVEAAAAAAVPVGQAAVAVDMEAVMVVDTKKSLHTQMEVVAAAAAVDGHQALEVLELVDGTVVMIHMVNMDHIAPQLLNQLPTLVITKLPDDNFHCNFSIFKIYSLCIASIFIILDKTKKKQKRENIAKPTITFSIILNYLIFIYLIESIINI